MQRMKSESNPIRVYAASFGVLCLTLLGLIMGSSPNETRRVNRYPGAEGITSGRLPPQNLVSNGGFENDFDGWTTEGDAVISGNAHSGAKALMASDLDSTRFSFVWQALNFAYDTTEVTFWVYPASAAYYHFFELIANWQPGPATLITRVTLRDDSIGFTAVGTTETIANVLTPNSWNKVTIQANSATLTLDFYVNDSLYSSITSLEFPLAEHLLVGDLSGSGNYGTVFYDDISITGTVVSPVPIAIEDEVPTSPSGLVLEQNFPNPFQAMTQIRYALSRPTAVSLAIYDIQGRKIRTLIAGEQGPGTQSVTWNGQDDAGFEAPSGVYFIRLTTSTFQQVRKMVVVK